MRLLLDNCEHVVDAAAEFAHAVLAGGPDVAILATSREILAVPGESVVRLGGLSLPSYTDLTVDQVMASEAARLFCARAAESAPGFAVTDANLDAVVRICRSLDGIPLALELAAARVRLLGAAALATRLDGLSLVGPRTADPRHRTLTAAISWSYDLLPEAERIVLRRLSVFPAPFTLAAAEAVAAKGTDGPEGPAAGEVVDLLGRLVDKSLVLTAPGDGNDPFYRLLETIRQYGAARLAQESETDTAHARLRDFLLAGFAGWPTRVFDVDWVHWVGREIEAIRAVLGWAEERGESATVLALTAPLWTYWSCAGSLPEAIPLLERAATLPSELDPLAAGQIRVALADALVHRGRGDAERCERLFRDSLALVESCPHTSSGAHFLFGQYLAGQGRVSEGLPYLERSSDLAAGEPAGPLRSMLAAVVAAVYQGDGSELLARLRETVEPSLADPDNFLAPHLLAYHAVAEAAGGDREVALRSADAALAQARASGLHQLVVMALVRSVECALLVGAVDPGEPLGELLHLLERLGLRRWVGESLELAGIVLERAGAPEAAATALGAAAARRHELNEGASGLPPMVALLEQCAASVEAALGVESAVAARRRGAALGVAGSLEFAMSSVCRGSRRGEGCR
ncbi:MAG: ATP-binding protein [Sporichthyaceae bacterium]